MLRIFLFLCSLIALTNLRAAACSCVGTSTVAGGLMRSDFVAAGTVKAKTLKVSPFLTTDICTRTIEANETELTELRKANSR